MSCACTFILSESNLICIRLAIELEINKEYQQGVPLTRGLVFGIAQTTLRHVISVLELFYGQDCCGHIIENTLLEFIMYCPHTPFSNTSISIHYQEKCSTIDNLSLEIAKYE